MLRGGLQLSIGNRLDRISRTSGTQRVLQRPEPEEATLKIGPIRSEETYARYFARASALMSKTNQKALDELEVLQALMERWERSQYNLPAPTPIEAIRFRMAQQGLSSRDLEPYIGSRSRVSEVLSGARPLSIDMIRALTRHLGIPAASLISAPEHSPARKRALPSKAAVEKLKSFQVMKPRETVEQFVSRVFPPAAQPALLRKTRTERTNAKTDLAALQAWCAAVVVKADAAKIPARRTAIRDERGRDLAKLSSHPDGPGRVADALREMGIVFVTLDHLPGTYLDGAVLSRTDGAPVIALTLRHDRIDNFWFTLLHEYCHVARHLNAETRVILDDLEVKTSDDVEGEADTFAQDALIPPRIWRRVSSPDMGIEDVLAAATEAQVHPAIVAGRWQREQKDYRRFAKVLGHGQVRVQLLD